MDTAQSVTVVEAASFLARLRRKTPRVKRYCKFAGVWFDEAGRTATEALSRQLESVLSGESARDDEREDLLRDIGAECVRLPTQALEMVLCAARTFGSDGENGEQSACDAASL